MTQPNLPSPEQQKQMAAEVFAQYEPPLYEAYLEMMLEWLAAVKAAMFAGGITKIGLVPNPIKVFSQTPKWTALTTKYSEQVAEEVLAAPYKDLFKDGTLFESRPFVRNWIADRENRLARVPDEVFGAVSQIIDSATTNGASIPDVTKQIEELFDGTDIEKWKARARTVARTEVVGAYNGGLYDSFAMIVAADPDTKWVKHWLATEDHRTRPDHVKADGQVVPWSQPFTVGGFPMMYPHDPQGPPQEVINCVVGSTQVDWPGQLIQGSTSRSHTGTFVQISTSKGHDLTVTPNHPVLTPDGYVPAGLLRPGQYVMGTHKPPMPQVGDGPSSAEEVHRALSKAGQPQRVVGSRMDFHGDGANSEVEIVGTDGYLPGDGNADRVRQTQKLLFVGLDSRERPMSGLSGAVVARLPVGGWEPTRSAPRLVSRKGSRPPLSGGHAGRADQIGLPVGADLQAHLLELPDDGRTADADFPSHLQYALAAGMTPCEVVGVEFLTGTHQVFNLSTSDHWYSANGIATHNCRCTMLLEVEGEPTDMSNRQYLSASFNPLEKRDKDGKWTKGGGLLKSLIKKKDSGGGNTVAKAGPAPWIHEKPSTESLPKTEHPKEPVAEKPTLGEPVSPSDSRRRDDAKVIGLPEDWNHENPDPRYASAENGAKALEQFKAVDTLPEDQGGALSYYSGDGFEDLNAGLARSAKLNEDPERFLTHTDQRALQLLDAATAPKTRSKDVIVWRGMRDGAAKFGDAWKGDMKGVEWTQGGYSSTSADFGIAAGFVSSRPDGVILRVLVPKEAKVGGVDMRGKANFNSHEAEVMFNRGVRYRVTADHGLSNGKRILDVEVVQ